jgi:hypothetical protein
MLSDRQIDLLTKDGVNFYTDCVLLLDTMSDRIKKLAARVKQLEAREQEREARNEIGQNHAKSARAARGGAAVVRLRAEDAKDATR